ncbi:MAG: proton-conducting transporter membrane subunit [Chloroflexi bacterium]|nr:proton-conducting transporter membrane subunit [Chloroflexota bacterium]MCY4247210.1 proton-conducting transporter membrane subunit [Chloroflexota bacterium]
MENLPLLVPLVIFVPALGAAANFFFGARLDEKWSGYIGCFASLFAFVVSLLLLVYVTGTNGAAAVVNPPFVDGWLRIESINLDIGWQLRVDSLSVTMMLVVTGVGSLIHLYARGYMHGDKGYPRFFAYLNMFLAFMLILVTANNFLMLFVGWEGVGLCSFLLIGFWWDKKAPEGWKNSNAARKAFIVNRIGDFGLLMAMFLIFWTFGTLDFFKAGELPNTSAKYLVGWQEHNGLLTHADDSQDDAATDAGHSAKPVCVPAAQRPADTYESADDAYSAANPLASDIRNQYCDNQHFDSAMLGVFGQTATRFGAAEMVDFGGFQLAFDDVIFLAALFMLLGVAGKSAQIPLFVWLPDAMAGPTPVSALIHAATMVTAGVYMMVRSNVFLWELNHAGYIIGMVITLVGAGTAIMAGFIALGQWDIKRVLAYSTISQLGFMVAAVGIGAYVAAMFHLVTHAVFKALLFLGSGSVIHGVEHGHHHAHSHSHDAQHGEHASAHGEADFDPQDMRNMGGLRRRMPITYITYLIGTLALAGIFPFAGFWSKDEILADAWYEGFQMNEASGFIAFGILLVAAAFTAFYMWRQIVLVFFDEARSEAAERAPESNGAMLLPLLILAVFTLLIGFINVPKATPIFAGIYHPYEFKHFLEHSVSSISKGHVLDFNLLIAGVALALGIGSIVAAHRIYKGKGLASGKRDQLELGGASRPLFRLANARLYWDELYTNIIEQPFNRLAGFLADRVDWDFLHDYFHDSLIKRGFDSIATLLSQPIDLGIVDGAVNGVGALVERAANWMRRWQTGYVRLYAIVLFFGVAAVIALMLLPFIQPLLQTGS